MPNTDWKQVCAACAEGTPPERCAYHGDPNGRNAPTLGKHPEGDLAERLQEALEKAERRIAELERATGNVAAMRAALNQLRDWALLDINENAIRSDEPSYKKLVDGIVEITNAALTAPPRNCDRQFRVFEEAIGAYVDGHISCPAFAVVRNSDVHCNITVIAECESARDAAKIARMMNAEEKGKRNA